VDQINLPHQPHDECFRCGYDLFGVRDDLPCPECGLLAERSRHKSGELHDSHPLWLRNMRRGLILLLLAMTSILVWPTLFFSMFGDEREALLHANYSLHSRFGNLNRHVNLNWLAENVDHFTPLFILGPSVLFLVSGIFLLTRPEGYPLADQTDHKRRRNMRILAVAALATLLLSVPLFLAHGSDDKEVRLQYILDSLIGLEISPLVLLVFLQLHSLADRMGGKFNRQHLLVGGYIATAAIFLGCGIELLHALSDYFGTVGPLLGSADGSIAATVISLLLPLSVVSLYFWCIYVLLKFILAFSEASANLRRKWAAHDLSLTKNDSNC
jgi:ribosomal protein L37E